MGGIIEELLDGDLEVDNKTRSKWICIALFLDVLRAKRETNDEADRAALSTIAKDLASASGAPYQAELIE